MDLLAVVKATEATVAFGATDGGTLATDSLTTLKTARVSHSWLQRLVVSQRALNVSRMGKSVVTRVSFSTHSSLPVSPLS